MARHLTYERQTIASANPAARYAHKSRIKRALNMAVSHLAENATLVDFGAGTGLLLSELRKRKPQATLLGIDPYKSPAYPGIEYRTSLSTVDDRTVNVVTAFEVCEHLTSAELHDFLKHTDRILIDGGFLILSVPIMDGPIVIAKEVSSMVLRRRACQYTTRELLRVTLGLPIERPQNPRHTHKGFNFRALRQAVHKQFELRMTSWSPFPSLPWPLNSQMFLVAQKKQASAI